ncbi:MAG: tRNA (N6-isopentenyl adenosine(37)-C2)-methylthiotransferase MiaB [Armatimonadota bacterium]|nr:MAG: tRNA (N6-isopentenyl adenosine(37)-C2)-methylthiotransferase MiaB [Armatimonadota bacterium]
MDTTDRTFLVKVWGCQMNEAEAERIGVQLRSLGWRPVADAGDADLVYLHTCCVRARPERKVYGFLDSLRALKRERPHMVIAVGGCMAQKEQERIFDRAPNADILVGPRRLSRLAELTDAVHKTGERQTDLALVDADPSLPEAPPALTAFVPIIEGCTNYCAYCIVPHVRGPEHSRPSQEIRTEVEHLAQRACREITLLGQNVLVYGADTPTERDFPALLEFVHDVKRIERIRFTTSHPKDAEEDFFRAVADLPKVCEAIHLPLQAGHDDLLAAMNRRYTVADYLRKAELARGIIPDLALSTDIIVGFPGETEEQFRASLEIYRCIRFDQAFMFAYSPREGTAAATLPDSVSRETKQRRLAELIDMQNAISTAINQAAVGREFDVLVEGPSAKDETRLSGRTRQNKLMVFDGPPELIGEFVTVKATAGHVWGIEGQAVMSP